MTTSGIICADGSTIEMDSPYDLGVERIAILKAQRPLICACRGEHALPLTVVESARTPHVRRVRDLDQHAPDCVFHRAYQAVGLADDRWSEQVVSCHPDPSSAEGFRRLARAIFSRSYTSAMVDSGTNATTRDCLARIRAELEAGFYLGARESLLKAAKKQGGQLFWGVVPHVANPFGLHMGDWPLVVHPSLKNGTVLEPLCLIGPTSVVADALRACSIWGAPIAGPYFALGLLDAASWRYCRVTLLPIAQDYDRIAAVDSAAEREAMLRYWQGGSRVYKPLRRRELNELPPMWRSRQGTDLEFAYRPDFLLLDSNTVVELIGFGKEHESYARTWAAKRAYWKSLETAGHCSLHVLRAREPAD